jgi:type II secretory pathway component PulK
MKRRAHESGQALLGILILGTLMTTVCLGYARHAVVTAANAESTVTVQQAEGAADSGLAWAKQTLLASGGRSTRLRSGISAKAGRPARKVSRK